MKNKFFYAFLFFIFFTLIVNTNFEKKYLDKLLLISNGTFEKLSVTILLRGNNIYENHIVNLIKSLPFETNYNLTTFKEDFKDVIIINFNDLTDYDQYKTMKNLFSSYDGKYFDYLKISGTYKVSILEDNFTKTKNSIKEYLKGKSFKVSEFENDNMTYINNHWVISNVEDFNIAMCNYNDGTYLYIGLPEIMMNY